MKTLDEVRKELAPMRLTDVSEGSGASYGAVWRLMQPGSNPSYETVRKISEWLESRQ